MIIFLAQDEPRQIRLDPLTYVYDPINARLIGSINADVFKHSFFLSSLSLPVDYSHQGSHEWLQLLTKVRTSGCSCSLAVTNGVSVSLNRKLFEMRNNQ